MSRGPDGRYAYRADANARGAVPVTCWACGRDIPAEEPVYTDRQWWVMIGTTHDGRSVSWTEQHGPWCAQCAPGAKGNHPWASWPWHVRQPIPSRPCAWCSRPYHGHPANRFCSERCANADRAERRRLARERQRSRCLCAVCGRQFTAPRQDARYCTPACRQKAYRARLAEQAARTARDRALLADYDARLGGAR